MNKYLAVVLILVVCLGRSVWAEDLTVERYLDLTVERLEQVLDNWRIQKAPLSSEELAPLWQRYGTTEQEYLNYGQSHSQLISDYLVNHDAINNTINELSIAIRAAIPEVSQ